MRTSRTFRLVCWLWVAAGLTGVELAHAQETQRAAEMRPAIAVLPFLNGGSFGREREDFAALEVGMQQILTTELSQNSALLVVDRSVLRKLLEEQDLGASGRVDDR